MTTTSGEQPLQGLTEERVPELRNLPVYSGGDEIGHVGDIYYDETSGTIRCIGVKGDVFGFKRQWIPAEGAVLRDDGVHVGYGREQFQDAPRWDDGDDLDEARLGELRDHFVRHEEELQVGKREVDAGSVRLRKWVETEPVAVDVELQRETATVVREDVDEPVSAGAGAFEEQEVEVPLSAERPVVAKETVAKERVAIEKDVDTRTETVTDELRKERVEADGDTV